VKPKVYLETTVISYLAAWPSRDVIRAAHQKITHEWWSRNSAYDLFVSAAVLEEAASGDPTAADDRLRILESIAVLDTDERARTLARLLIESGTVPETVAVDAFHVAIATVHHVDYLLTWNCKHIANPRVRKAVGEISRSLGYSEVGICTPEELLAI